MRFRTIVLAAVLLNPAWAVAQVTQDRTPANGKDAESVPSKVSPAAEPAVQIPTANPPKRPEGHPGAQSIPPAEGKTFPLPGTPVKE